MKAYKIHEMEEFTRGRDPYEKLGIGNRRVAPEIADPDGKLDRELDASYYARVLGFGAKDIEEPYPEVSSLLTDLKRQLEYLDGDIDWYYVKGLIDKTDAYNETYTRFMEEAQITWIHA